MLNMGGAQAFVLLAIDKPLRLSRRPALFVQAQFFHGPANQP